MNKRVISVCMAILIALAMMPGSTFAASKQVVVTSVTTYNNSNDGLQKAFEFKYNYKDGLLNDNTEITYYNDFKTGELEIDEQWDYTYEYDNKGRLTTEYIDRNGKPFNKTKSFYENGKLVKKKCYEYKNGKYTLDTRTTYKESSKKSIVRMYFSYGTMFSKEITTFNSKGKPLTYKVYDGNDKKPSETTKYYYKKNKVTLTKTVNTMPGVYVDTTYYNKKGQQTKSIYKSTDVVQTTTYEYDSYGRLRFEKVEHAYNNGKKQVDKYKYKYSGSNFGSKKYHSVKKVYCNGKLVTKEYFKYKKI